MTRAGEGARHDPADGPEGMKIIRSLHAPRQTIDRLADAATTRGMTIFARIDHGAGAEAVGMALRPTELILFGNPRAGTLLMQATQTIGIDLPLKALAWQDKAGVTWLGTNDPLWLANRHNLPVDPGTAVHAMSETLAAIAQEATGPVAAVHS
jgi:uncharacterized protein (DUF302 family)